MMWGELGTVGVLLAILTVWWAIASDAATENTPSQTKTHPSMGPVGVICLTVAFIVTIYITRG